MSAYLKQTDYVNAYDLARDKKVIEGQAKLSDLPRLKDMILPDRRNRDIPNLQE